MHKSLTPRTNILLISLWAFVLRGASLVAWPEVTWLAFATFLLGVAAGLLQANALSKSSAKFRTAQTAIQVRHAFMSSKAGQISIALLWGAVVIAVVWSFRSGFHNPFAALVAAYASFALAREVFLLRRYGTWRKSHESFAQPIIPADGFAVR